MALTPGSTYVLTIRTSGEVTVEDPQGEKSTTPNNAEYSFTLRPRDVDQQGNTLVSVETGKTQFPGELSELSAAFQGHSFGMKLSPQGSIVSFENTAALRQQVLGRVPDRKLAAKAISDAGLKSLIEPVIAIWPTVPVSAGDEWDGPDSYVPLLDVLASMHFTLKSRTDSGAVVEFTSASRPAGRIAEVDSKITGTGKGEIHISTTDGTIRSFESNRELSGTLTRPNTGAVTRISASNRTQAELRAR
jgi:hypothetical protein